MIKTINENKIFDIQDVCGLIDLPLKGGFPDRLSRLQYNLGSCVGASSAQAMSEIVGFPVSIMWIYANCKLVDGIPNLEGTTPEAMEYVLTEIGVIHEDSLPYSDEYNQFNLPELKDEWYIEAKKHAIKGVSYCKDSKQIKLALSNRYPVLFGAVISEDFRFDEDGMIDGFHGIVAGAHEMYIGGYDDNMSFLFENGESKKGFFRIEQTWLNKDKTGLWGSHDGNGFVSYDAFDEWIFIWEGAEGFQMWDHAIALIPTEEQIEQMKLRKRLVEFIISSNIYYVNSESKDLDVPANIYDSRTFLPIRACAEALGKDVRWIDSTREILISDEFGTIRFKIDSNEIWFKAIGQREWYKSTTIMDVVPFIETVEINNIQIGRTLIPVRYVAEKLGATVGWDGVLNKVSVEL